MIILCFQTLLYVTARANLTPVCNPDECDEWDCRSWCACFDQRLEDKGMYKRECRDDGDAACICTE